ncbi:MAG: hypothetical protein SFV19_11895 [Rhodospirillaceae bacterium]|nr:hypothetical protein [Rhodospirillaceae bacterium]
MAKLVWMCAWIAVVVWSLLCWAAFGLIDVASGLATGSSGMFSEILPGSEPRVRGLADLADDVGEVLLFITWIGVGAMILGGAWLFAQFTGGARVKLTAWPDTHDAPADTRRSHTDMVDAAMKRFGRSAADIRTLKRVPGQDQWRA